MCYILPADKVALIYKANQTSLYNRQFSPMVKYGVKMSRDLHNPKPF